MIQRIQSLYLFLALLLSVLLYVMPFSIIAIQGAFIELAIYGFGGDFPFAYLSAILLNAIITLTTLVALFLYKNRSLQMRLTLLSMLLSIGLVVVFLFYIYAEVGSLKFKPLIAFTFPIIMAILNLLAFWGIRKDDILVKSLNRIR